MVVWGFAGEDRRNSEKNLVWKHWIIYIMVVDGCLWLGNKKCAQNVGVGSLERWSCLTPNIPSLARQRCLPSWGPRRIPWIFCNFSTVWCGRLFKLCFFLGFWNYNTVIKALLASNILRLFISTEVTGGTELLITHPASEQCHLLSIVGGLFFKFTTFRT